jgi:hypothetical protein
MSEEKKNELLHDHNHGGVDQQGSLKCVARAGAGALWAMQGGALKSYNLSSMLESGPKAKSILIERKRT